ncbi:MotA/TolQ/ExbB proton channel family protein [Belliella sp. DSM 107340]|uniref:MotA/TolQ/ExbB proton channel family protein n=1 Tax=Belliella calami TaxID=2923436 RepID=A0ABS9UJH0_9BACT|nr:MotA/TolQ/ExbB proton channel family protein [Belliella calami]MCH7396732.1 MotA/TolQ/ExbB proton channel family protein [Belliella calami]
MSKLFRPFLSPETFGDYTTILFTVGIFIYFIIEVIRFNRKIGKLKSELKNLDINDQVKLENSSTLSGVWISYKSSFGFGDLNKTTEDARDYFNEYNLILNNSNFRYYLTLPNIFVGLGILGTFVGLVYGISSFDNLSDSSVIKESISVLLSGMGTAFYTSIVGMFFSIFFNIIEKKQFYKTFRKIKQISNELNNTYRISKIELEQQNHKSLVKVLSEVFSYTSSEGVQVPPNMVFYTLDQELKEQSRALKSFSTDLANSLEAMSTIIMEEFDQSFQRVFQETLLPVIEKLDKAVEALKNEKSSTNENLINSTIEALKKTMQAMMEDFKDTLSGSAKNEIDNMLKVLNASSTALISLPHQLGKIEDVLDETIRTFKDISDKTLRNTETQEQEHAKSRTKLNETTNEVLDKANRMIESADNFIGDFVKEAGNLTEAIKEYHHLISSLKDTASSINQTTDKLNRSVELIDQYSNKSIESNKLLTENFENQLAQITRMNSEHVESYNKIKESLGTVFDGIEEGLTTYRDHTVESLNTYLGEFSEKLAKASNALSGSISELNEGLDGLNDFLGRVKR